MSEVALAPAGTDPSVAIRHIEELRFRAFGDKMRGPDRHRFDSWQLRDIRTVVPTLQYIVTVGVKAAPETVGHAGRSVDIDEVWTNLASEWVVQWDGLNEAG